ncbi:MAG: hypothetical protein J1G02_06590 [Clostridiales bacterium]|nr:hypothetical protein [Clostridiales bacterium]
MAKQSNRLVILLDRITLGGAYLDGIQNINANSRMVNQLVVRVGRWSGQCNDNYIYDDPNSKFTLQQLSVGETLWVYFNKHDEPHTVHSCLLMERNITRFAETAEVDYGVGQEEIREEGREYWIYIPDPVMCNPGQWNFSFAIKHIASRETGDDGKVKYVYDYKKTSSACNPFNLIVNPSIVYDDDGDAVTNANLAAVWEQIQTLTVEQGIRGYQIEFTKDGARREGYPTAEWQSKNGESWAFGAYLQLPTMFFGALPKPYVAEIVVKNAVRVDGTVEVEEETNIDFAYRTHFNGTNADYIKIYVDIDLSRYTTYNGTILIKEM